MEIEDNNNTEVILWQSTNIALPNGKYLIILYYYKTFKGEQKKNGFYRCAARIDTKENWNILRNSLLHNNPAAYVNLNADIGISNENYELRYSNRKYIKADMYNWFGCKFSEKKIETLEHFINETQKNKKNKFITKYNIDNEEIDITTDYEKLEDSKWYVTEKTKKTERKPYGRVIH